MHLWLINILTFKIIFDILKLTKSWKLKKIGRFWIKRCPFIQNFAKQPNIFWFPKFLELFLTPRNIPPNVKNSKPNKSNILFGTPCKYYVNLRNVLREAFKEKKKYGNFPTFYSRSQFGLLSLAAARSGCTTVACFQMSWFLIVLTIQRSISAEKAALKMNLELWGGWWWWPFWILLSA